MSWTGSSPFQPVAALFSWSYDGAGNRLTQTSGSQVTSYTYDGADQLTSTSGAFAETYAYDANGNRTAAGSDTFAYDWRNRLRSATVGATTVAICLHA